MPRATLRRRDPGHGPLRALPNKPVTSKRLGCNWGAKAKHRVERPPHPTGTPLAPAVTNSIARRRSCENPDAHRVGMPARYDERRADVRRAMPRIAADGSDQTGRGPQPIRRAAIRIRLKTPTVERRHDRCISIDVAHDRQAGRRVDLIDATEKRGDIRIHLRRRHMKNAVEHIIVRAIAMSFQDLILLFHRSWCRVLRCGRGAATLRPRLLETSSSHFVCLQSLSFSI